MPGTEIRDWQLARKATLRDTYQFLLSTRPASLRLDQKQQMAYGFAFLP